MNAEEYRESIVEMVGNLISEDRLMKIYYFVKVKYDKEKK